ncbi:MAG: hypothetical protein Q7U05_03785 [Polaromonas sp.]|nr:hypothetical protein [Polaromonas sp.]
MTKNKVILQALEYVGAMQLAGVHGAVVAHDKTILTGVLMTDLREAFTQPDHIAGAGKKAGQEPKVNMSRVAQFKLDSLLNEGFVVNGYAIERHNHSAVTRGFITAGGMVCWWFDRDHEPASPPKRQPLTVQQILVSREIVLGNSTAHHVAIWEFIEIVRAIEAAHGIKGQL